MINVDFMADLISNLERIMTNSCSSLEVSIQVSCQYSGRIKEE